METHNHTGYTSDRGSPAWKHTFTQEDIQALWGVQHKHTRIYKLCGSPAWKRTIIQDIQATVGVQHGNTHSHKRIYRLYLNPSLKALISNNRITAIKSLNPLYAAHQNIHKSVYKLCGSPA